MVSHVSHLFKDDIIKIQGFVHCSFVDYECVHGGHLIVVSRLGNYIVGNVPTE